MIVVGISADHSTNAGPVSWCHGSEKCATFGGVF